MVSSAVRRRLRPTAQIQRCSIIAYLLQRSELAAGFHEQLATSSGRRTCAPVREPDDRSAVIPVALPPLAEQRAIAHILGTLDDKIELNRRMNETLEAMARALFKSWFVDFDPVRAKAEGRDPGLPKPLADLFPDSFEDSELGEIPRGWARHADRRPGRRLSAEALRVQGHVPTLLGWRGIRSLGYTQGPFWVLQHARVAGQLSAESQTPVLPQIGSGLLAKRNSLCCRRAAPIGYLAIAERARCDTNQGFIAMKPRAGRFERYSCYLWAEWVPCSEDRQPS